MSFPALIELRDRLDAMSRQIRSERHIVSPVLRCPKSGTIGPSAEPYVSVRALILTLGRFEAGSRIVCALVKGVKVVHESSMRLDPFWLGAITATRDTAKLAYQNGVACKLLLRAGQRC